MNRARRREADDALSIGSMREIARADLLAEEEIPKLAGTSLWLLGAGSLVFGALDAAAWLARAHRPLPGRTLLGRISRLIAGNVAAYTLMLPLHEVAHAGAILALGGRPRFGARFPFVLYCSAPDQVFTRAGYSLVLLAPLVTLSTVGAALTWRSPVAGAYLLFALAGNVSGAVGDLVTTRAVLRLPPAALIADTATGFTAYLASSEQ
jgi:hypothetical protein